MSGKSILRSGTVDIHRLWKRFRADRRRPVLRDEVGRITEGLTGRSDPSRWRWALRDLSVSFEPGEAVGLFGTNGSGKSTLLKILTKVMYPTAGRLSIGGRVGALIEIRAGVHPDLTGRENIYLYGSIMGLRRHEIAKRFDEIVEFAELSEALDRQLKYYSSGMAMRLGFAVAAFLQPDVLLVDEVLAVGDASFQQRCLDRMRSVLQEGTTLVFVSHDLASIESIAKRGLWLRSGVLAADGPIREAVSAYRQHIESAAEFSPGSASDLGVQVIVAGPDGGSPATEEPARITVTLRSGRPRDVTLFMGVSEGSAAPVFTMRHEVHLLGGVSSHACDLRSLPLPGGRYWVWLAVTEVTGSDVLPWHPAVTFDVRGPQLEPVLPGVMRLSPVLVGTSWESLDATSATRSDPLATTPRTDT